MTLTDLTLTLVEIKKEFSLVGVKIELEYFDCGEGTPAELNVNKREGKFIIYCWRTISQYGKEIVLRHECVHISDILDSHFGYDLEYLESGTDPQKILKIKLLMLFWDISIVFELEKRGFSDPETIEKRVKGFKDHVLKDSFNFNDDFNNEIMLIKTLRHNSALTFNEMKKMADKFFIVALN